MEERSLDLVLLLPSEWWFTARLWYLQEALVSLHHRKWFPPNFKRLGFHLNHGIRYQIELTNTVLFPRSPPTPRHLGNSTTSSRKLNESQILFIAFVEEKKTQIHFLCLRVLNKRGEQNPKVIFKRKTQNEILNTRGGHNSIWPLRKCLDIPKWLIVLFKVINRKSLLF